MIDFFALHLKEWESKFFGFPFGLLLPTEKVPMSDQDFPFVGIAEELEKLLWGPMQVYDKVEANIEWKYFPMIPLLEDAGFRLIDTKCTFVTQLKKQEISSQIFPIKREDLIIRDIRVSDFDQILEITKTVLLPDKNFRSKYKNRFFFHESAALDYFNQWVMSNFQDPNALWAILLDSEDQVKGYFLYRKNGVQDGFNVYKGILTAIKPEARGSNIHLSLQSYILERIEEEIFYIDNSTQLTNLPILQNHIRSNRTLKSTSFILLKNMK
jgi:hypothetical protein